MLLSTGDYLFVYNSANASFACVLRRMGRIIPFQPRYHVGWVVLSGADPSVILARASTPLLWPDLAWEAGATTPTPPTHPHTSPPPR